MDQLTRLAILVKERNRVEAEITAIIQRPAQAGHVGEFIASKVFDLTLHPSASYKGSDGYFNTGPLAGRSVNVKWYTKLDYVLDVNPETLPDYYLVLTGPLTSATSQDASHPWVISMVYLFDAPALLQTLRSGKAKIGVASSVKKALWDAAEIYPHQRNKLLLLTDAQRAQLALFSPGSPNEPNLYTAIGSLFIDDSFAEEVDAYIREERQRERDAAAREAEA